MYYGPESLKSKGMLVVEIIENDRQQWSGQKFSNLKMLVLGMLVPITTLQGIWSDVILAMGMTKVFG